jgi:hypothetical protein
MRLQGLAQAAVLASTPAMAAALRGVLDGLHRQGLQHISHPHSYFCRSVRL